MNAPRERAFLSGKRKLTEVVLHLFDECAKVCLVRIYFPLERAKLNGSSEPTAQLVILRKYGKATLQPCRDYRQVCLLILRSDQQFFQKIGSLPRHIRVRINKMLEIIKREHTHLTLFADVQYSNCHIMCVASHPERISEP